jgi:hypothetical protein
MSVASGSDPGSNVPYVARQLRNAARKNIAMIRARFDNDREAAPSKKWAALDDLIKKEGVVSYSSLAFQPTLPISLLQRMGNRASD